jgi:hypothetical protein
MKRCLHKMVDFKTNVLNYDHASQLLNYKAGLLQSNSSQSWVENTNMTYVSPVYKL